MKKKNLWRPFFAFAGGGDLALFGGDVGTWVSEVVVVAVVVLLMCGVGLVVVTASVSL